MPAVKAKYVLPAVGVAAVVAGGVAAYLYFRVGPGDSTGPLASARVVPNQALMAAYISTDDQAWSELEKFGTPEAQTLVRKNLQTFKRSLFTQNNLDFDRDVKPWAGSVMFAVLPAENQKAAGTKATASDPNVLMVVSIKNKGNALSFANKLKSQKGITAKEDSYNGVMLAQIADKPGDTYNVAVLNDHLVVSPNRKSVEQAIDTFKGAPSLAKREGMTTLFGSGVDLKNPLAQIYLPDYASAVQQLAANDSEFPLPTNFNQLKQVKSMVIGMGVDDQGIRVKATAKLDPQATAQEYKPVSGKVIAQLPGDAIAVLGGQGLKYTWAGMVSQAQNDPSTGLVVNLVKNQLQAANLDADKDLFGWMDGEFALAAIPSNQGFLAKTTGFGGALVIQTNNRATAEATLAKLDNLAKNSSVTVSQRDIQGKTVTEWRIAPEEALLGHGWLDQKSLFVAIGGPIVDVMANKPQTTLDTSETYKTATKSLPKDNIGYFYLDMDRVLALINSEPFKAQASTIPPDTTTILQSIQGVAVSATQPDKSTSQFELLMALKPRQ